MPIERASSKHNDVFVWADERQGIDINAGITFIPKNALVDPENGSLYQRDAEGLPIEEQVQEEEKNPNHLYYKRAQSQVPSQEYWEKYFVEHPDQRPTKIVYYDTSLSPTEALWKWKEDNGIIKQGTSEALGFTANQESRDSHRTDQDYIKDLNAILLRALAVEYPITSIVAQYNADRGGYPQTKEDLERVVQEINMTDV